MNESLPIKTSTVRLSNLSQKVRHFDGFSCTTFYIENVLPLLLVTVYISLFSFRLEHFKKIDEYHVQLQLQKCTQLKGKLI